MRHVKGILLHGPPGNGKTLIARKIGALLNGPNKVEPKVVNGPELLNKFVGESEKNLRALFEDARRDQSEKGDASPLHVIIFDEIDALFKTRGRDGGAGAGVGDTIVNQMLTQIDGVDSLNNILVIGMTNRKDVLDPALLRPGRLEVHLEIGLPDAAGRKQIFDIHMKTMRENGRVSSNVDLPLLVVRTKNYAGTDVLVEMCHFLQAIDDVRPAFGVDEDRLAHLTTTQPMIDIGPRHSELVANCQRMIQQTLREKDPSASLFTLLLTGEPGAGKTTFAAHLAAASGFPFVRFLSSDQFVGKSEAAKIHEITRTFEDAYRSTASLIVLDSLERLVEYIGVGPRFSAAVLQTLLVLLARTPPHGRRLVVVGTTSREQQLDDLELVSSFQVRERVPLVRAADETRAVLQHVKSKVPWKLLNTCLASDVAIRTLLAVLRAIKTKSSSLDRVIDEDAVLAALRQCGVTSCHHAPFD
jgi:vesicle-fusing ATPase